MRGEDFLDLATNLAKAGSEAAHRSAVSRAYYGAFHVAKELLAHAGIVLPDTAAAHQKTQYCFKQCGERDGLEAGDHLEILRDQRNLADYNLRDLRFRHKRNADKALVLAREILAVTISLRSEPAWSRFRASVRTYASQVLRLTIT
jgi:uncharacterized protein (UPF0332 family)